MIIIASPSLLIFRAVRTFNVLHAIMLLQQQDSLASADRAFLGGRPNTRSHEARSAAAVVKQGLHVAS
jgi:hypothetical protein